MHSTLKPKQADDPHDVVVVAPDVARVVPAFEELSNLLREAARHSSAAQAHTEPNLAAAPPVPPVDTRFRAAAVNDVQHDVHVAESPRSIGQRAARAFVAVLLTTCIGVAGFVLNAHGDVAKQMIVKPVTKLLTSLLLEKPGLPAQPAAPAVEADAASADAANAVPPQPAPPAPAATDSAAPATAAASPDQGPLLQSMARDLAGLGQQVEQLKASIEELKAGQQQMSRDMAKASDAKAPEAKASEAKASEAKASEQNLRPKLSALPPRPVAARPRKPMPSYLPPQAAAAPPLPQSTAPYVPPAAAPYVPPPPQATAQPQDEELSSVPRPPMPVR
jgi:hypothetical protein